MAVAPVHRVGARREWLALAAAVRRVAGRLAVDDVGGDGQHRLRVHRVAIGRVLADLGHEARDQVGGDVVHPAIGIAEFREVALDPVVDRQARVVADHVHLGVLDRREAVGHDREPGDAERHRAQDVAVVQRHLQALVEVLVVHVVDAVHRMHVGAREPLHRGVELREHLVVVQHVGR